MYDFSTVEDWVFSRGLGVVIRVYDGGWGFCALYEGDIEESVFSVQQTCVGWVERVEESIYDIRGETGGRGVKRSAHPPPQYGTWNTYQRYPNEAQICIYSPKTGPKPQRLTYSPHPYHPSYERTG